MTESGKGTGRKVVLAYCAAPFADEGLVPLSVLPGVAGVVVAPDRNKEEEEHDWADYKVDLYRKGRHGGRAGHHYANVRHEGNERYRSGPQNQFQVGPLGGRNETLRKCRLLETSCGRSSDQDIGSSTGEQKSQHSGPRVYEKKPFSVSQRDFL